MHEEEDCHIVEWLNNQPNTSSTIREALRETMAGSESQRSHYTEILTILHELQSRPFVFAGKENAQHVDELELELAETRKEIENFQIELDEERKEIESLQVELGAYNETTYTVHWEGPYGWGKEWGLGDTCPVQNHHVLYQIYGAHSIYGKNILLYIGSSSQDLMGRLETHNKDYSFNESPSQVSIRVASINSYKSNEENKETEGELVRKIEALLIFAHQPCHNQKSKRGASAARGIRIFNTGKYGDLLPEVSYRYFQS